MKRRRERSKRMRVMNLWNRKDVDKAVPYLRSVVASLREHWLDVLSVQRDMDKTAAQTGLARTQQMIAMQANQDERQRAQTMFDDALVELNAIDVFLLDPVRGLALIPFRKGDELAWYVFDQFTPRGVIGWRLHNDPIEECRPLETAEEAVTNDSLAN